MTAEDVLLGARRVLRGNAVISTGVLHTFENVDSQARASLTKMPRQTGIRSGYG